MFRILSKSRAKISGKDIWQLFVQDDKGKWEMMTNARWPNAKWSDKSIFYGKNWAAVGGNWKFPLSMRGIDNKYDLGTGKIFNNDTSLEDSNIDMTGAMAVMNIGSFLTFVAKVKNHKKGANSFEFDDDFGDYPFKAQKSIYFLEDKLELLDAPEEWFYDKKTQMLYLWTPDGTMPETDKVRGKVQTYAFKIRDCSHLVLKDLKFFATTITATNDAKTKTKVDHIRFDSLQFEYPSYSKRMLGDISLIKKMKIGTVARKVDRKGKPTKFYEDGEGHFIFYNNRFYGSDGYVAFVNGFEVTFENNLFEWNDWSAANTIEATGGIGLMESKTQNDNYIRNTLYYNGAKAGLQPGKNPVVKYNMIIGQCKGVIQNDGAGIQVSSTL